MTPYYQDNACTLYHGDCREVLPTLPAQSVHLLCVDPPYFGVKAEAWDRQWASPAAYLDWLRGLCQEWRRVLVPNGSLYCFASPDMATDVELVIRETFHVLNRLMWYKSTGNRNWGSNKEEVRAFLPNTEHIIFAEPWGTDRNAMHQAGYEEQARQLHKRVYSPIGDYIRQERERAGWTRRAVEVALGYVSTADPTQGTALCYRWEEGSALPTREAYERLRHVLNNGQPDAYLRKEYEDLRKEYEDLRKEYEDLRRPFFLTASAQFTDVWTFAPVQAAPGKHPCEKPLALLSHIVRVSSRPGDTLLDCCAGSGSALEAAKRLGRKAIGIESHARYCALAVQRLQQEALPFPDM